MTTEEIKNITKEIEQKMIRINQECIENGLRDANFIIEVTKDPLESFNFINITK